MTRFLTNYWLLAKDTAASWVNHKDARQGAALAYYSVFSLGPVLVIAVAIAGFIFGQDAARGEVEVQLKSLLGRTAAKAVDAMLAGASAPKQGLVATVVGTVILLFTAVGVVIQLKDAFNTVWGTQLPETALQITGSLISFVVITVLFAMMFKWLPDTPVEWRDVWLGAAITAALFEIGKLLIGIYIGKLALDSTYGAATSLVVLLIWVYYSSQIVLLGAESR